MKKIFIFFFLFAASVEILNAGSVNGNCGSHLWWSLNTDEGVLVIEGSGTMFNWYSASDPQWYEWSEYIEKVILPPDLTSINQYAFQSLTNLTIVEWNCRNCTISDYLTRTPFYENRSQITSFIFGEEVETIPQYLCYEMTNLTEVVIPNSVHTIGFKSFYACSSLSIVRIGSGVTTIGGNAFYDCDALVGVYISDIAAWCSIDFGAIANPLIYAKNLYLNGELLEDLVIPNGVTIIKNDVFYNGLNFKSLSIPNSVTTIGESSFYQCRSLKSVNIPNSVTSIGRSAFNICDSIETVTLGNSVNSIGDYAFWNCPFTAITIPASVTNIGNGALVNAKLEEILVEAENQNYCSVDGVLFNKDTTSLLQYPSKKSEEYAMPKSVITIGDLAFFYSQLTHIELPEGVKSIGYDSFGSCRKLLSITLPNSLVTIGRYAFSSCEKLEEIVITNNVTSIAEQAFYNCQSLKNVTIGSNVTSIGQYLFRDCSNISSIYNYASTPQAILSNVFDSVDKYSCILYVPEESINLYETADVWKEFASIVVIPDPINTIENDYTINYVDKASQDLYDEVVTLHVPVAPSITGFTFLKWVVVGGDLVDTITIQAVYQADIPSSAPAVYTNPANPAQKLIKNGNVYILTDDKTYTITGLQVK